ncbi:hypothetical protein HCBG_06258 [Histoplasma capsulatum G186AR]|uniref:Dolichyl-diphosphooligosaccharide--protein glycosyltransferase subunit 4 n=1 Tax=Ajellomyces capsulatus (strain G186AR / H82 / ATCC MYA-2454 / RMSCC 2432) TaxID=447093 RepID=C0NSX8_AJECG|nr:uncharacterized protein HCBG_06258 [Histoplasma capsulatum G186AR]EEH05139.1 hypothetical protein HCBG_06258 [Histoplasma capsulatum G186AR]
MFPRSCAIRNLIDSPIYIRFIYITLRVLYSHSGDNDIDLAKGQLSHTTTKDVVTLKMISDEQLYQLAMFLGSCAMLLIVLYHYLEVNAKDSSATSSTSSQSSSVQSHASTSSSKNSISTTPINRDAAG